MRTADRRWLLAVVVGALAAAGCSLTETGGEALSAYAGEEAEIVPDYIVEQPDTIRVEVTGHGEISREAQLRPDGKITMPLLGDISVTGLTPLEIDEKLTKLYSRYLKEVDITVTVTTFASKKVYVFRDPGRAHTLPYAGKQDLLETIAQAGGPGPQAAYWRIRLVRASVEKPEIRRVDLRDIINKGLLDEEHNPTIRDGDIIHIPMDWVSAISFYVNKAMQPVNAAFQPIRALDVWQDVMEDE